MKNAQCPEFALPVDQGSWMLSDTESRTNPFAVNPSGDSFRFGDLKVFRIYLATPTPTREKSHGPPPLPVNSPDEHKQGFENSPKTNKKKITFGAEALPGFHFR